MDKKSKYIKKTVCCSHQQTAKNRVRDKHAPLKYYFISIDIYCQEMRGRYGNIKIFWNYCGFVYMLFIDSIYIYLNSK